MKVFVRTILFVITTYGDGFIVLKKFSSITLSATLFLDSICNYKNGKDKMTHLNAIKSCGAHALLFTFLTCSSINIEGCSNSHASIYSIHMMEYSSSIYHYSFIYDSLILIIK